MLSGIIAVGCLCGGIGEYALGVALIGGVGAIANKVRVFNKKKGQTVKLFVSFEAKVQGEIVGRLYGFRKGTDTKSFVAATSLSFDTDEEAYEWLMTKVDSQWTQISREGKLFKHSYV